MQAIIKKSLICKKIANYLLDESLKTWYVPKVGDVALFRIKTIGKHSRLQNDKGSNRLLFAGDLVLCAFGHRYATNQIEGYVPDQVQEEYHMLGQGGVVGIVKSMYAPLEEKGPTTLELIGYATDEQGGVLNTKVPFQDLLGLAGRNQNQAKVILSIGSSMDSGKTTTAGYLCRGLEKAGKRAAYMKLTGTIFTKDANFALDCGASTAIDFGHFSYPSTFLCDEPELVCLFHALMHELEADAPDYVVVEIADGLLQRETNALLRNAGFMSFVDEVIFSAGDSLSVLSGLSLLQSMGVTPFGLSGIFSSHPLLVEEVKNNLPDIPVLTLSDLEDPAVLGLVEQPSILVRKPLAHVA